MQTSRLETVPRWRVSLHGGHSGEFCDHADGSLRAMLEAAVQAGYHTFGVTEHAPRTEARFLYPEEIRLGWTVEKLAADFERYRLCLTPLAEEFQDRLEVLRGFECEVAPSAGYVELMRAHRHSLLPDGRPAFDYCVGSVHYVNELQIDGHPDGFLESVEALGGLENLAVRYYETVGQMAAALRPEVVGHFDLVKKNVARAGLRVEALWAERVRRAALGALEEVRDAGGILDLNTAGWRKGLGEPYPAPWIVEAANSMGIGFCFGDDSHRPAEVGAGVDDAAAYLRRHGVTSIAVLTRQGPIASGKTVRLAVPLDA